MRWHLADEERDNQPALFGVDELVGPQRGTGSLSHLEFLHVAAKRILNQVPATSQMPFRWTINVYRGCSHGCTYCLDGATRILMVDGSTGRLRDIRLGDQVYGTRLEQHRPPLRPHDRVGALVRRPSRRFASTSPTAPPSPPAAITAS